MLNASSARLGARQNLEPPPDVFTAGRKAMGGAALGGWLPHRTLGHFEEDLFQIAGLGSKMSNLDIVPHQLR